MKTFKLTIEYDGSRFSGWQRQDDQPTIQGELETVLSQILNQKVRIHGSGRTDAGVHARGQVAHVRAETRLEPLALLRGANSLMRHPIVIRECALVPNDFHAQFNARSKEYRYYILNRPVAAAVGRDFCWHVPHPLNLEVMNRCSEILTGIHDFKAFENTGSPRSSTVREVFRAGWRREPDDLLVFSICASGFLKNMVRNIVGTLKEAGMGKMDPGRFSQILVSCDRSCASATAPASGLFLHQVFY